MGRAAFGFAFQYIEVEVPCWSTWCVECIQWLVEECGFPVNAPVDTRYGAAPFDTEFLLDYVVLWQEAFPVYDVLNYLLPLGATSCRGKDGGLFGYLWEVAPLTHGYYEWH